MKKKRRIALKITLVLEGTGLRLGEGPCDGQRASELSPGHRLGAPGGGRSGSRGLWREGDLFLGVLDV